MKVVIATPLYPPEIGGPATHTLLLEKHLPRRGVQVKVVPFAGVRRWPKGARHVLYALKLYQEVRNADLIFAQDTVSVGFPAAMVAYVTRRPLIVRVPGDHAWEQARVRYGVVASIEDFQMKHYGWQVEMLRRISRLVVRSATRVVVPSHYFAGIVRGWLRDPQALRVVYNGVESTQDGGATPSPQPTHPYAVSVGRLVPWKGFEALIDTLTFVPEWSLVIVGEGPLRQVLESRAKACGVAERVLFVGNVARDEVVAWYRAADCFVFNTAWESFSYQVAEAMTVGVPIIATNVCSVPELIENQTQGVLVAPNDTQAFARAMQSVLTAKELWHTRTISAQQKAQEFSAAATAEAIAALVREVVS